MAANVLWLKVPLLKCFWVLWQTNCSTLKSFVFQRTACMLSSWERVLLKLRLNYCAEKNLIGYVFFHWALAALICFINIFHKMPFLNFAFLMIAFSPPPIENQGGTLGLQCRSCHRSFSNRRQILKHICLGEDEEEDQENNGETNQKYCEWVNVLKRPVWSFDMTYSFPGRTNSSAGEEGSGNLDPGGADPNQTEQNSARQRFTAENGSFINTCFVKKSYFPSPKCLWILSSSIFFAFSLSEQSSLRPSKTNRSSNCKEGNLTTGNKKSVISVFLTGDETLPG